MNLIETFKNHWKLALLGIAIATIVFFTMFGGFAEAETYSDTFDSYSTGDLFSQSDWYSINQAVGTVSNSSYYSSPNSFVCGSTFSGDFAGYQTTANDSGLIQAKFYVPTIGASANERMGLATFNDAYNISNGFRLMIQGDGTVRTSNAYGLTGDFANSSLFTIMSTGWKELSIRWQEVAGNTQFKFCLEDNCTDWLDAGSLKEVYAVGFQTNTNGNGSYYMDNYSYYSDADTPPEGTTIYAIDPASGTIITSTSESFEFGWGGAGEYDIMYVGFKNRLTGINSDFLNYEVADLVGYTTTVSLDAFGVDKNGDWYFQGYFLTQSPEVLYGNTFTGRYITTSTDDLAYDFNYYLTYSIVGYETMFNMPAFEDWYSINSTRYDTPTDMFISITDFFSPIFSKVGEFGSRIDDYFDLDEAYQYGFDIGKNIPVFGYYLTQISYFIGNFPFIKWFLISLLFFVGIFIFRLIIKFIPFLGGS